MFNRTKHSFNSSSEIIWFRKCVEIYCDLCWCLICLITLWDSINLMKHIDLTKADPKDLYQSIMAFNYLLKYIIFLSFSTSAKFLNILIKIFLCSYTHPLVTGSRVHALSLISPLDLWEFRLSHFPFFCFVLLFFGLGTTPGHMQRGYSSLCTQIVPDCLWTR